MTSLLLIGLLGVLFLIIFRGPITAKFGNDKPLIQTLQNATWFHNHCLSGLFLFTMNASLFLSTVLVLYITTYFIIPFIHLLVMALAVVGSIYLWISIRNAWQGSNKNLLKVSVSEVVFI